MRGKLRMVAFALVVALLSYIAVTRVISPRLMEKKTELEKKKTEMKEDPSPEKKSEKKETTADPPGKAVEEEAKKGEGKDQPKKGFLRGKLKMVAFVLVVALLSFIAGTRVVSPRLMEKKKIEMKAQPSPEKKSEKKETTADPSGKAVEEEAKKGEGKDQPKKGFLKGKQRMIAFALVVALVSYIAVTRVVSPRLMEKKKELEKKKTEMKEQRPQRPKADMIGEIYTIDNIIVNPAGSGGERFVKTSVALELGEAKLDQELSKRDVQLRDILIGIFSSKTIEELTNSAKREDLREEVKQRINSLLVGGKIKNVYFTDLVIQ